MYHYVATLNLSCKISIISIPQPVVVNDSVTIVDVPEYQKYVKLFFSLFLDNTLPVRIVPVFFEVYLTGISDYNHKPFEARRSWWNPLSKMSEIGNLV